LRSSGLEDASAVVGARGEEGASAPPKVLICKTFGQNLLKFPRTANFALVELSGGRQFVK